MIKMLIVNVKRQENKFRSFAVLAISFLVFGCSEPTSLNDRLPILGHYDVLEKDFDGHKKGDTLWHTIPDFSYIDQDSNEVTHAQLEGRIWVAKFFFTTCPTICPPMTQSMKTFKTEMAEWDDHIYYLSFSINPKTDTPSRLLAYREEHQIEANNWFFLTNDDEEGTHFLGTEGFKIHAMSDEYAPGGYAHSPNFVLVDQYQRIRGIYDGLEPDQLNQLKLDLIKLLNDEYNITR
jgi:protein SCO1